MLDLPLWTVRVHDPFAENSTAALEEEVTSFVHRLKEQAVTATLLGGASDEQRKAVQAIHYGATTAEREINYWRRVSWCAPSATPAEVVARVEAETLGNLKYILYETTSEEYVDGPDGIRDFQRGQMKFDDFMRHENVSAAELTRPHVAALRLYTTLAFKYINSPLRHQSEYYDQSKPHPLPRTVAYINEGVKKLRAACAASRPTTSLFIAPSSPRARPPHRRLTTRYLASSPRPPSTCFRSLDLILRYATRVAAGTVQPTTTLWRGMKKCASSRVGIHRPLRAAAPHALLPISVRSRAPRRLDTRLRSQCGHERRLHVCGREWQPQGWHRVPHPQRLEPAPLPPNRPNPSARVPLSPVNVNS